MLRAAYDLTVERERLEHIAKRHGIRLLLQFGSSVSGHEHAGSDIDIAVLLDDPALSYDATGSLYADLQALFPQREVDVAIVNTADPLFLKQIMSTARLVYGDERSLHELRIYAFKRYQDHRRFLALERSYVERIVQALAPR
jgi:predicted nucleotidyltransferase